MYICCIIYYMKEVTSIPLFYGSRRRGVTSADVERAADQVLRTGERPTVERIRANLGTGSPNTINPLLDAWWKRLANRLDAGPAALHRLPEGVAHVAESLWMQALEEARRRALLELDSDKRAVDQAKDGYEVRSHVLSLREGELDSRLRERDRAYTQLEAQLRTLTNLLKKEQKTGDVQAKRIAELESESHRARQPKKRMVPTKATSKPNAQRSRETKRPVKRAKAKRSIKGRLLRARRPSRS